MDYFQNQVDEGNLAKYLSPKHLHFGRFWWDTSLGESPNRRLIFMVNVGKYTSSMDGMIWYGSWCFPGILSIPNDQALDGFGHIAQHGPWKLQMTERSHHGVSSNWDYTPWN